ncbi:unnamed protein product, partial [marine sediment metagenome]
MSNFWQSVGNVLGNIGSGIGSILQQTLPTAIPAGLNYLASRENSDAAHDLAKMASGASGGAA